MKIRHDFVSNSSSASFVVQQESGDLKLLCQKMAELFNQISIPYGIDDKIDISVSVKNKWYRDVFKVLKPNEECRYTDTVVDWYSKKTVKKDPEDISWDSIKINVEELIQLATTDIIEKIDHIYFSSVDENDDVCNFYLAKFYRFFEAIDCNPDASSTERDFLGLENEEFFSIMTKITNQKMKGIIA